MAKKKNKQHFNIVKFIISFIVAFPCSVVIFLITIPFLNTSNNIATGQVLFNLIKINVIFAAVTALINLLTFKLNKFKYLGYSFIIYLILGIFLSIFVLSSNTTNNNSQNNNNLTTISDWNSCNEQENLQKAKACTYSINTDTGTGSGFGIENNYLVTNFHVIDGARKIFTFTSESGDKEIPVKLWAYSEKEDLAILKIDQGVSSCNLINSDNLPLAETLYAIGWPLGLSGESSITKGTFSRKIKDGSTEIIQTDTPINPGNSGGPLVSRCGIIGINQSIIRWSDSKTPAEGIGFAISSSHLIPLVKSLIANGSEISLPVSSENSINYQSNNQGQNNNQGSNGYTGYDVNGWVGARDTTRRLLEYWNSSAVGGYDQGKVAAIKDLLIRMSSVMENIIPKMQRGVALSSEEDRLLGEWNSMYSNVNNLIFQLKYNR